MSLSNILNIQEQRPTPTPVPGGGRPVPGGGGRPVTGGGGRTPAPAPAPAQPKTNDNPVYTELEKDYPKIAIYSRLFIFLTKDGPFYLNTLTEKEFADILVKTNDKKMQLSTNLPTAFIKSVVETYPQIIKVSVPEKIGNDIVELQFEFFTRIKGLQTILEQAQTPTKYITYKIVDGLLKKPTDDDNWIDATYKTIKSIAGGGTEVRKGERSGAVESIKKTLGYKDNTIYFTEDFNTFLRNYKGTNKLDNTNGNIDQDLICSIEIYQRYCPSQGVGKTTPTNTTATPTNTTTTPTNTTTSKPIELKYLNDYATAVGNGIPSYGTCKSLFDYYSEQALNYRRLKKVNQAPNITKVDLKPIQDKILYCQKSSNLTDRAKLDTLISQRFRIQQDKDSPYYLDI